MKNHCRFFSKARVVFSCSMTFNMAVSGNIVKHFNTKWKQMTFQSFKDTQGCFGSAIFHCLNFTFNAKFERDKRKTEINYNVPWLIVCSTLLDERTVKLNNSVWAASSKSCRRDNYSQYNEGMDFKTMARHDIVIV